MNDKEIASQLRKPHGGPAVKMGEEMSWKNRGMISDTIELLIMKDAANILEIGFGSGTHIDQIFGKNTTVNYSGIDISGTMVEETEERCRGHIRTGRVSLKLTDGKTIPFEKSVFSSVFSVNTLYFWDDVPGYLG